MKYKKGDVCSFLLAYQVEKGSEYTHTSMIKPTGSFYIPIEKTDDFYKLYNRAVQFGEDLYLTEKHRDIAPMVIDLDFRFEKSRGVNRVFTDAHISDILSSYIKHIREYVDIDEFDMYVLLKPNPVVDKEFVKDGIHIVVPDVVTKPSVQFLIRKHVLGECDGILGNLKLKNSYENVIDEAVIERNNWQMYGSKKPNCDKYQISKIIHVDKDGNMSENIVANDVNYAELLSIRNKYDVSPTKIEKAEEVSNFEKELKKTKKPKMAPNMLQTVQNNRRNTYDNLDIVGKLVDILNEERSNNYMDWIRLGWCLRTIDYRLLDRWVEFSKKSSKYTDGECDKIWNYMKEDGLSIGSLHMWAKQDNLELYKEIIKKDLSTLVFRSKNCSHHDVACVVHHMFRYDFVCCSISKNIWYEFRNHRWVKCDAGHSLRAKISTDVCREYLNHAAIYGQRGASQDDEEEQSRCAEIGKKMNEIALKLKQTAFKDNIMKESKELFFVEKFEEKLDSKCTLIGFENGVYDLENLEFREGRADDYLSFSTGINYVEHDPDHPIALEVNDFLTKVIPKPHVREYVLLLLASFLNGAVKEERFHIWTGSGCFAAGTPVLMYSGESKAVEDISCGDKLMGDDSTPRTVKKLFRGFSDMYNIKPRNGNPFKVNGEHKLVVKDADGKLRILTVHEYLEIPTSETKLFTMYRPKLVQFESRNVDESPYMVGWNAHKAKQIPTDYKVNDETVRMEVLAGIIDSIGLYQLEASQMIINIDGVLANDIVWIARSLGITCFKEDDHVVLCDNLGDIPVRTPIKILQKGAWQKCSASNGEQYSFSVSRIEDGNFFGFEVDGNHLFLKGDGDFTVLSNSNGKSKTIDLFEQSYGDYCCKLPITLLTQKRAASNAATSEVARTKGKRFACLQEPSEDEKLNVGLMKELTGGDKIQARQLFSEPIEFKPQFKMILTCNTLPNVPSDDGGTWRRIRVVEFSSKFCDNPDPEKTNEFKIDTELSEKFGGWKEYFMSLLIEYYKKYMEFGIVEPDEVLECTKEYQKNNDTFLEFIEQECERCEEEFVSYNDIFSSFKMWCKENHIQMAVNKKTVFVKSVGKTLGKFVQMGKVEGWKGWRFKQNDFLDNDLDI